MIRKSSLSGAGGQYPTDSSTPLLEEAEMGITENRASDLEPARCCWRPGWRATYLQLDDIDRLSNALHLEWIGHCTDFYPGKSYCRHIYVWLIVTTLFLVTTVVAWTRARCWIEFDCELLCSVATPAYKTLILLSKPLSKHPASFVLQLWHLHLGEFHTLRFHLNYQWRVTSRTLLW